MGINYKKDYSYADTRLSDTLVKTSEGVPYFVFGVHSDGIAEGITTPTGEGWHLCLEELDMDPFKLGYINVRNGCTFSARIPARKYKQGLRQNSIYFSYGSVSVKSQQFADMLLNKYPNIGFVAEQVSNGESMMMGFSRHFAIKPKKHLNRFGLMWKCLDVGDVEIKNEYSINPVFKEEFVFLAESFKEALDENCS